MQEVCIYFRGVNNKVQLLRQKLFDLKVKKSYLVLFRVSVLSVI